MIKQHAITVQNNSVLYVGAIIKEYAILRRNSKVH